MDWYYKIAFYLIVFYIVYFITNPLLILIYYKFKYGKDVKIMYYPIIGYVKFLQNGEKYKNDSMSYKREFIK